MYLAIKPLVIHLPDVTVVLAVAAAVFIEGRDKQLLLVAAA